MPSTVGELRAVLEAAYPPVLAESWDTGIGLTCGDPARSVTSVLFAVDVDAEVVAEAEALGAQLIVTHHPLLFRPVQSVAADTDKGRLVHRLISGGIAHLAIHTNADKAAGTRTSAGGVNDALAAAIGVRHTHPLVPDPEGLLPPEHPQQGRTGTGRIGTLPAPMALQAFVGLVAGVLPDTAAGVRAAGNPDRLITTVALCGGAGDSLLDTAARQHADVYITSDLRHHVVAEHLADASRPAVIDIAHWAGEWLWLADAAALVDRAVADAAPTGSVITTVSAVRSDPWAIHVCQGHVVPGQVTEVQGELHPTEEGPDTSAEG